MLQQIREKLPIEYISSLIPLFILENMIIFQYFISCSGKEHNSIFERIQSNDLNSFG